MLVKWRNGAVAFLLALIYAYPATAQTLETQARRNAAIADFHKVCGQWYPVGSYHIFDEHRSHSVKSYREYEIVKPLRTVAEMQGMIARSQAHSRNHGAPGPLCSINLAIKHAMYGVPGYDGGSGATRHSAPAPAPGPSVAANPAPPRPAPAAKLPPARPAKMMAWSSKAMSIDPTRVLSPRFVAERADALASCSGPMQQFTSHFSSTITSSNLIIEQFWLADSDMSATADQVRNNIAVVEGQVAAGNLDPGTLAARRTGLCVKRRRLAQLEGSPLTTGAVDGSLTPLSIGGKTPPWKQQGKDARVIASDGKSAMDCVKLVQLASGDSSTSGGGRVLSNQCSGPVEITWCYSPGDCDPGRVGNSWTVGAGRSWPVSAEQNIRWAACHGANTAAFVKGSQGLRYYCSAPLAKSKR